MALLQVPPKPGLRRRTQQARHCVAGEALSDGLHFTERAASNKAGDHTLFRRAIRQPAEHVAQKNGT